MMAEAKGKDGQPEAALLIRGGRIVDPANQIDVVGDLLIVGGKVAAVGAVTSPSGATVLDASGKVVAPGFIDLHCHLREPGQEDKETIQSGTAAAAAGGFTAVCAMPNTQPAIDDRAAVEFVQQLARLRGSVRVYAVGAITKGRKGEQLAELADMAAGGAVGFSDDGSGVQNSRLLRNALQYSTMLGLPIIEHCEDAELVAEGAMNEGVVSNSLGLPGMPAESESIMAARNIALAGLTGSHLHLAHVSTAQTVAHLRAAQAAGQQVTAEVTPHHLTMTDEWVAGYKSLAGQPVSSQRPSYSFATATAPTTAALDQQPPPQPPAKEEGERGYAELAAYDTNTKVNPPLRGEADRLAVLAALRDGTISVIATDHAPHTAVDKAEEYGYAAFGISGIETAFGLLMTLVHSSALDLPTLIERLTAGPARTFNLPGGNLAVGQPGDVVILDPDAQWSVEPAKLLSKGKNTPLAGLTLRGKVLATIVGGKLVYEG